MPTRKALVQGRDLTQEMLERYLPDNYRVVEHLDEATEVGSTTAQMIRVGVGSRLQAYLIEGEDEHGWTLHSYVIPRLASGLIGCEELQPLGGQ